ncbi:MAG TPA: ammonia-forming cytochrome c nitrite reductase subunit c552 [Kofleriaceae bacterium]|nr:ammonia-forming cytochrome c nitrite reductase subunit c552 [Kofleriaceae bacterium]
MPTERKRSRHLVYAAIGVAAAAAAAGLVALLVNIFERKAEGRSPYVRVVDVGEDDTDPAIWGKNWPAQFDSYKRTAITTRTRFGGHGGNEAMPEEKIERDPWLKRMFLGYAFSIDYRDRRGHAYMLADQEATQRLTKPQSGSCLHCHASIMPLYRKLGGGDPFKGLDETSRHSYQEVSLMLHEDGQVHPVSCVDCHDPRTMALRVTRPGFIRGIEALAASDAAVPAFSSITQWRAGDRKQPYDPNADGSRNEMRSFVCGQCHVEYYCSSKMPLTFPWARGLQVEQIEAFWDATRFPDGTPFYDYEHAETGAHVLKAQHPEFELWNQGVHARSGVSCADCHMPYMREGATKISDHWVRSPLLNINRACQTCHRFAESELLARVDAIQQRNHDLLERGGVALTGLLDALIAARSNGATADQLAAARQLQRRAQWRLDFIAAENSMGFHAPQEAARILGEAIDYARQGQISAMTATDAILIPGTSAPSAAPAPAAPPARAPAAPTAAPAPAAPPATAKPARAMPAPPAH